MSVRNRVGCQGRPRGEMGEVWPHCALRRGAANRVAARALARHELLLTPPRGCRRRSSGRRGHVREPAMERRRRLRDHPHRHVRVLEAAELSALAAIDARLVGDEQDSVRLARDHVDLPVQLRYPERMDDVVGLRDDLHPRAGRDVDLVRRHRVGPRITHLPEPLVAGDLDAHRRRAPRRGRPSGRSRRGSRSQRGRSTRSPGRRFRSRPPCGCPPSRCDR